jgi:hypothetical protein
MYPKPLLILVALFSYCHAQQSTSSIVTSLDAITQSLSDVTALINAVPSRADVTNGEKTQVSFDRDSYRTVDALQLTTPFETMINRYTAAVQTESEFANQNQASSTTALTEGEQAEICSSLKSVSHLVLTSNHYNHTDNSTYHSPTPNTPPSSRL